MFPFNQIGRSGCHIGDEMNRGGCLKEPSPLLAAIVWAGVEIWGHHIEPDKSQTVVPAPSTSVGTQPQGGTIDNTAPAGQSSQPAPTDTTQN